MLAFDSQPSRRLRQEAPFRQREQATDLFSKDCETEDDGSGTLCVRRTWHLVGDSGHRSVTVQSEALASSMVVTHESSGNGCRRSTRVNARYARGAMQYWFDAKKEHEFVKSAGMT